MIAITKLACYGAVGFLLGLGGIETTGWIFYGVILLMGINDILAVLYSI